MLSRYRAFLLATLAVLLLWVANAGDLNAVDDIFIGGGNAGCTAAYHHAKNFPTHEVVLFESGGETWDTQLNSVIGFGSIADIPDNLRHQFSRESIDYFGTEFRTASRLISIPRGLGGGMSAITGSFHRQLCSDFDAWPLQSPEWNCAKLVEEWKALENYVSYQDVPPNYDYHGTDGKIRVSSFKPDSNVQSVIDALLGYYNVSWTYDQESTTDWSKVFSAPRAVKYNATTGSVFRQDPCSVYLGAQSDPADVPPNLHVLLDTTVTKINFKTNNSTGLYADSVEYVRYGEAQKQMKARGEIVLTGGTLNDPSLLQRSGVGDCAKLAAVGVPCVHHLPAVGQNMQTNTHRGLTYITPFAPDVPSPGPIVSAYRRTSHADPNYVGPDGEISFAMQTLAPGVHFLLFENLIHTNPTPGSVEIVSSNPTVEPRIVTNVARFEHEVYGIAEIMLDVMNFMDNIKYYGYQKFYPVGDTVSFARDLTTLAKQIMNYNNLAAHRVGTCAIGSVVDDHLRVYGIDKLRVASGSVIPVSNKAHATASGATFVGKRLATMLKEETQSSA